MVREVALLDIGVGPDHIHHKDVEPRVAVAQLLGEQIVELRGGLGADLGNDFDAGIQPFEIGERLLPDLGRLRLPGDETKLGGLRRQRDDPQDAEKTADQKENLRRPAATVSRVPHQILTRDAPSLRDWQVEKSTP